MILEFDIGNTRAKWRLLSNSSVIQVVGRGFIPTGDLPSFSSDVLPASSKVSRIRLASVAQASVTDHLSLCLFERYKVPVERAYTQAFYAGVKNSYSDPSKMGVDRWLTLLAAYHRAQGACCVVDCGTAIKIEYISAEGQHLGGYILPGADMMVESLLKNTAQISQGMTSGEVCLGPGTNTVGAVRGGAHYLVSALREQLMRDLELQGGCPVYVTGGNAAAFLIPNVFGESCPDLVFEGLGLVLS